MDCNYNVFVFILHGGLVPVIGLYIVASTVVTGHYGNSILHCGLAIKHYRGLAIRLAKHFKASN